MSGGKIFISYRRADTEGYAGRIYDRLSASFSEDKIFMDVSDIDPGEDFVELIENAVSSCDVLVALIGKQWLDIRDENAQRRLENPNDFVRLEISAALRREIRVIPVLLHGASMPRANDLPKNLIPITRRNALEIRHASLNIDIGKLQKSLKKYLCAPKDSKSPASPADTQIFGSSLDVNLIASPNPVTQNGDVNWTVIVINKDNIPMKNLTVLHRRKVLLSNINLVPGETQWISFETNYSKTGEFSERIQILGHGISVEASNIVHVENPPQLHISLISNNSEVEVNQEAQWVIELENLGGGDLHRVMIIHDQKLLEDPLDLPVGKSYRTRFVKSYSKKGNTKEIVTINAMTKSGDVIQIKKEAVILVKSEVTGKKKRAPSQTQELVNLKQFLPHIIESPIHLELIRIPGGEFLMGSDEDLDMNSIDREYPLHPVYLPDFFIGKYLITNLQYDVFLKSSNYQKPPDWDEATANTSKGEYPVINVSWYDAMAFCEWMSEKTKKSISIPSEAEWEKASRGINGRIYPWGNKWDNSFCNTNASETLGPTQVGRYSPRGDSPFGCSDMAGNIWEWTCSNWGENPITPQFMYPYDPNDGRENIDAPNNMLRIVRGGAWCHEPKRARCAFRGRYFPDVKLNRRGFRVVLHNK